MYKIFIRTLLFSLRAETAHRIVVWGLRIFGRMPFVKAMLRSVYGVEHASLERELLGLNFRNPIGMAAGFDVNGDIIDELGAMGFGFVEVGSITPEPQPGNPMPRLFRLGGDRAIINRFGHPNRGWEYTIKRLRRRHSGVVVGCNITRNNNTPHSGAAREYLKSFRNLYQYADYFTVNLDFDHVVREEGASYDEAIVALLEPLFDFRRGQSDYRPIMLKLSADLSDEMVEVVSRVLKATPLDGIVAVGGTMHRDGLKMSEDALTRIGKGRLSGAPLRERALEVVRMIHAATDGAYPIIGVGGLMTGDDVKAMMEAGACLVQVYSGLIFEGPSVAGKMCEALITNPVAAEVEEDQGEEIEDLQKK